MDYITFTKLKSNPKLYPYLKENTEWLKHLNRHPELYKDYENYIKDKYKLKPAAKISSAIDNLDLVVNVINTLK